MLDTPVPGEDLVRSYGTAIGNARQSQFSFSTNAECRLCTIAYGMAQGPRVSSSKRLGESRQKIQPSPNLSNLKLTPCSLE
jgi:hypothetical protein